MLYEVITRNGDEETAGEQNQGIATTEPDVQFVAGGDELFRVACQIDRVEDVITSYSIHYTKLYERSWPVKDCPVETARRILLQLPWYQSEPP